MPTDAGTDTWTAAVSGSDALRDAATVTATIAHSAAEKFADSATAVLVCVPYPTTEGVLHRGTATNTGAHTALPTVTITGPGTNPGLVNETTGDKMLWDDPFYPLTLGPSDTLVADCRARRATLNGEHVRYPSGWLTLQPGANTIAARCAGPSSGFAIDVEWSDAWQS